MKKYAGFDIKNPVASAVNLMVEFYAEIYKKMVNNCKIEPTGWGSFQLKMSNIFARFGVTGTGTPDTKPQCLELSTLFWSS